MSAAAASRSFRNACSTREDSNLPTFGWVARCPALHSPSGQVFRRDGANGPVWYAKYRLPTGRQVKRKIGPAWTGRGRPPTGYVTKRLAEAWLRDVLDQARRATLPGSVQTGATFADAAAEFLRYVEQDRTCKPSTLRDYRSSINHHLLRLAAAQRTIR